MGVVYCPNCGLGIDDGMYSECPVCKTKLPKVSQKIDNSSTNKPKKNMWKIAIAVIAAIIALAVSAWFIYIRLTVKETNIVSASMEYTYEEGDVVNYSTRINKIERFDVVVFRFPDDNDRIMVKRIIGLPGETVMIKDGKVYIDDELLEEDYLRETPFEENLGPFHVPEDGYFVMGDNRNNSHDSRYWNNTYLSFDEIIGKVIGKR